MVCLPCSSQWCAPSPAAGRRPHDRRQGARGQRRQDDGRPRARRRAHPDGAHGHLCQQRGLDGRRAAARVGRGGGGRGGGGGGGGGGTGVAFAPPAEPSRQLHVPQRRRRLLQRRGGRRGHPRQPPDRARHVALRRQRRRVRCMARLQHRRPAEYASRPNLRCSHLSLRPAPAQPDRHRLRQLERAAPPLRAVARRRRQRAVHRRGAVGDGGGVADPDCHRRRL